MLKSANYFVGTNISSLYLDRLTLSTAIPPPPKPWEVDPNRRVRGIVDNGHATWHCKGVISIALQWIQLQSLVPTARPIRQRRFQRITKADLDMSPANTRLRYNAELMLAQRRRRWASIKPALGKGIMIGGELFLVSLSGSVWYTYSILMTQAKTEKHWVDAGLVLPAVTQYCSNSHSLCLGPPTALCLDTLVTGRHRTWKGFEATFVHI